MSMFKDDHGAVKPSGEKASAKVYSECGSGSRPTPSKHAIETSAPAEPHGLSRSTKGALK